MTGDAATHEALRALPPSRSAAASETDAAFEAIKSRVCRVGRGQPCGDRIGALDRNTLFLTVYDRFGSSDRWVEVLLHDGAVAAIGRHD